jgi:hypothetical protein
MPVVARHDDNPASIARNTQYRRDLAHSLSGPGQLDLVGTCELRVHGIMDNANDALELVGNRVANARLQSRARPKFSFVEQARFEAGPRCCDQRRVRSKSCLLG